MRGLLYFFCLEENVQAEVIAGFLQLGVRADTCFHGREPETLVEKFFVGDVLINLGEVQRGLCQRIIGLLES